MTKFVNLALRIFLTLLGFIPSFAQQTNIFFTKDPAISPDGRTIYFSYAGDIYSASSEGSNAHIIASTEGEDTKPVISSDGKLLAFSSDLLGNEDVFLVNLVSKKIEQITFHEASDKPESWSWDSQKLYINSTRYNRSSTYEIHIKNAPTPRRLFNHYFDNTHNVFPIPESELFYFNNSWESQRFANRLGYKGPYDPEIKTINPATGEVNNLTDYEGKDMFASTDSLGNTYFISDEETGIFNLFTFKNKKKLRLTSFKEPVFEARVNAGGQKVVFRKGYQIWIYDIAKDSAYAPAFNIAGFDVSEYAREFDTKASIDYFDVLDGKIAFSSRGRLFLSDKEGKYILPVETNESEAVGDVIWLDKNRLAFTQSVDGFYQYFVFDLQSESTTQVTKGNKNHRLLTVSPDGDRACFLSGRDELWSLDLKSLKIDLLFKEEFWALYNDDLRFTPDGRGLLVVTHKNFEEDILLYSFEEKSFKNITNTVVSEGEPFMSSDGKFLLLTSDILNPTYPYGAEDQNIYKMPLAPFQEILEKEKALELLKVAENQEASYFEKWDFEYGMKNLSPIGPTFGTQRSPYYLDGEDGAYHVLFISDHDEGKDKLYRYTYKPFEKEETNAVSGADFSSYSLVQDAEDYYLSDGKKIYTYDNTAAAVTELAINYSFDKSLKQEFRQMFFEAWALMQENFYSKDFHGLDWTETRKKYEAYLPHVKTRADLRLIINDMLGELNASHLGFYSSGDEEQQKLEYRTMGTGIIFSDNYPFTVKSIVRNSTADQFNVNIKIGDQLLAVDGSKPEPTFNRNKLFYGPQFSEALALRFQRDGEIVEQILKTQSYRKTRAQLYQEWTDKNQKYVDSISSEQVAYIHMKNMGSGSFNEFLTEMNREAAYKKALILDLRWNTGGNVHDKVLNVLQQKKYIKWKYREGNPTYQSYLSPSDKPIVMLINEQSLSDAEITAAGFKELGLGTLVGNETYRWIIFTTSAGLVDGSRIRVPAWGCYKLNGDNIEKTGVQPDVYVSKNLEDRLKGKYPQIEQALNIILKQLH